MSWVGFISPTQQPVGTRAGMVLLLLFSRQVMSNAWQHSNGLQHARLPCPSLSPRICSSACPLSQRCHPTISLFVGPFSFCTQSFLHQGLSSKSPLCIRWPKYWSFSFSISPPMNIQDSFTLGVTGLIFLLSKGLSRAFSSTTAQKHQFSAFWVQLSHLFMTTGKIIALTIQTFVGK